MRTDTQSVRRHAIRNKRAMLLLSLSTLVTTLLPPSTTIMPAVWLAEASTVSLPCPRHQRHRPRVLVRPRFWFFPDVSTKPTQSTTDTTTTVTTPMGELAELFARIPLETLDWQPLWKALMRYEAIMRAVGQTQSAKDLHSNIAKVQQVFNAINPSINKNINNDNNNMPLYDLLAYERNVLKAHADCPPQRLKDPSAAMGLLWIRRSLAFNCRFFSQVLAQTNDNSDNTIDNEDCTPAALAAYRSELEPFHGAFFKRLYVMGIQAATPPRRQLLATLAGKTTQKDKGSSSSMLLSPDELQAAEQDLQKLVDTWKPLLQKWSDIFAELDLDDTRRV